MLLFLSISNLYASFLYKFIIVPISLKLLIFLLSILIILSSLINPEIYAGLSYSTSFTIGGTKAFPIIQKIKANPIMPNIKFAKGPANTIENL